MADDRIQVDLNRGVVAVRGQVGIVLLSAIRKALHPTPVSYDPGFGIRIPVDQLSKLQSAKTTWGLSSADKSLLEELAGLDVGSPQSITLQARPCRQAPWFVEILLPLSFSENPDINKVMAAVDGAFTSQDPKHPPARQFFIDRKSGLLGWKLRGSLSDFYMMLTAIERRGLDSSQVKHIIEDMGARGMIPQGRERGVLQGSKTFEEMKQGVKEYEDNFFIGTAIPFQKRHFAPEQVKGISFLYSNASALLGDDVGVGKTVQTVVAAEMRRRQSGGLVLFITQAILVDQIKAEIERITGLADSEVSTDFRSRKPYRVISYNLFGNPGTRGDATDVLAKEADSGIIKVIVLDEVHNVKNGNPDKRDPSGNRKHKESHQTFNIQEITKNVPFVWGASATVIGNTPTDLYNELRAVNHPLGRMPYDEFRLRFDPQDADLSMRLMAADELKERIIHSGVYLQRSKEQIRPDMPELTISSMRVRLPNINMPDNATKRREQLAIAKVPQTVALMMRVIRRGEKAAVFTSFKASLNGLVRMLQEQMQAAGITGRVATIEGQQPSRKDIIREFRNPASDFRAIVISTPAGGTGLDFPNILTDVFVNDFDWSVARDAQSLGRFHRINSQEPIDVTYVVADGEDAEGFNRLQMKKQVAEELRRLDQQEVDLLHAGIEGSDARIERLRRERLTLHMQLQTLDQMP
jgi:SNF2 family DNA or RNA helicase